MGYAYFITTLIKGFSAVFSLMLLYICIYDSAMIKVSLNNCTSCCGWMDYR